MTADRPGIPLKDFFAGVAEHAFQTRLGIADPPLIDYITELLTRFIRSDALFPVRDLAGNRLDEIGRMMLEAEARLGEARRQVHRHIGDVTLFWTGVYPEALKRSSGDNRFVNYCQQGKRAYKIASTIAIAEPDVESEVLQRLSEEFELCAYGLNEARREWERRDSDGSWRLVVFN